MYCSKAVFCIPYSIITDLTSLRRGVKQGNNVAQIESDLQLTVQKFGLYEHGINKDVLTKLA